MPNAVYQITIMDMTGRRVRAQTLTGGLAHTLEVGPLTSGSYLVVVSNGDSKITLRLLKQ